MCSNGRLSSSKETLGQVEYMLAGVVFRGTLLRLKMGRWEVTHLIVYLRVDGCIALRLPKYRNFKAF